MANPTLPLPLAPVCAPLEAEFVERVVRSLGPAGAGSRALAARGLAPPNALVGINLSLIASQPTRERPERAPTASPIAGGVWVREQQSVHRPVRIGEQLETRGEIVRRYVRKGRQYSVTLSETRDRAGERVLATCTTGLLRYRADAALRDAEEEHGEPAVAPPAPVAPAAARNPARAALRVLRTGERLQGAEARITLELMRLRDGARARNPIHTDPEAAREAGLDAPIAGGSHVLAFVQELLVERLGGEALLHGVYTDVEWLAPVRAERSVAPCVEVVRLLDDRLELALEARCEGVLAMRGTLIVPLGDHA